MKKMAEEPQHPAVADNSSSAGQNTVFVPDLTAPQISNIELKNVNYNTVDISWNTDEPSSSQLIWRIKDGSQQTSELKAALVTHHLIELTNLKNKSTFFYKVRSVDQAGNEAVSGEKTFDIGIQKGVAKVEVAWSAIKTVEQQAGVFKTIINGEIKNTGEATLSIKEIAVAVTISVTGKPGVSTVQASLDPYPLDIYPQEVHKFTVGVPSRTEPVYKVEASIIEE
ncbi:MAG: fibronectin type III domain-containing protein [Chloroflexi bacterium]|nr:fibronectin type III domain-containing protein [Chloroflexota bacterium]